MALTLTQTIRKLALESGVDLVGMAPIDRFKDIGSQNHPSSIFPEAKTVIALAKRITRGCLRGAEEGTNLSIYPTYGMNWVPHRFLALATVAVASTLEDSRHEAVPLADLPSETPPMGIPVKPGMPAPNVMVNFTDAAVRCGLGQIGMMGELMTPEFGHLQRLTLILTDAQLDATPLCEQNVCNGCGACAASCPFEAVDVKGAGEVTILGKTARVAKIDGKACARCQNGVYPNPNHHSGRPDRLAALCMRSCSLLQDRRDQLTRGLISPFRDKPSWVIGRDGVARVGNEEA